jgi:hypothetical protein
MHSSNRMSVTLPPAHKLVRTLSTYHWEQGLAVFDGQRVVRVADMTSRGNYWLHTIESVQSKIMCITRLNGAIYDMFEAKEIR